MRSGQEGERSTHHAMSVEVAKSRGVKDTTKINEMKDAVAAIGQEGKRPRKVGPIAGVPKLDKIEADVKLMAATTRADTQVSLIEEKCLELFAGTAGADQGSTTRRRRDT